MLARTGGGSRDSSLLPNAHALMERETSAALCSALANCQSSVTLVSPFVKSAALGRLLEALPKSVVLTVITRWRPLEIAAGVSDLAVLDQCLARPGGVLYLLDNLHAKYYRVDDSVFIGSANLTAAGLGWSSAPNLEILHQVGFDENWERFEQLVLMRSARATRELRDVVQAAVDSLPPTQPIPFGSVEDQLPTGIGTSATLRWVPSSRSPESLFSCYQGCHDRVTQSAMKAGQWDVSALSLPSGLSADQFVSFTRAALLQQPVMRELREISGDGPRFGELKVRFSKRFALELEGRDVTEATQTLMRWATCFFPDRYRVRVFRYSECLQYVDG